MGVMTFSFLGFRAAVRQSTLQVAKAVNLRLFVDDSLGRLDDGSGAGAGAGAGPELEDGAGAGAGSGAGAALPSSPKDGMRKAALNSS